MPWVTKYTDAFARANENPIQAPWANDVVGFSNMKIQNLWVGGIAASGPNMTRHTGAMSFDQAVEATLWNAPAGGALLQGIAVRIEPGFARAHVLYVQMSGPNDWSFLKYEGGGWQLKGTGAYPNPNISRIRLEAVGNQYTPYCDGVALSAPITSDYAGGLSINQRGTGLYATTGGASFIYGLKNFQADEWVAGRRRRRRHWGGELWDVIPEVAPYLG